MPKSINADSKPEQKEEVISTVRVTGTHQVVTPTDKAVLTIGIREEAKTPKEAYVAGTQKSENLKQILLDLGIEKKHIKTVNFRINPIFDYSLNRPRIDGYEYNNDFIVTVLEIDRLEEVLGAAFDEGMATQLNDIAFTETEQEDARKQALKDAYDNAKEKAEILMQDAEYSEIRIKSIDEVSTNGYIDPFIGGMGMVDEAAKDFVAPGESVSKVQVIVEFEFVK